MDLVFSGYLLGLSIEDIRKRKLSVWILGIGFAGSILYGFVYNGLFEVLTGIIPGAFLFILSILLPHSVGLGDGILTIIYGVVYGWKKVCFWLIFGFLLAAVFGVYISLFRKGMCRMIPLVPFLTLVHVGMCL